MDIWENWEVVERVEGGSKKKKNQFQIHLNNNSEPVRLLNFSMPRKNQWKTRISKHMSHFIIDGVLL